MGTRGLYGFQKGNLIKVTFRMSDSYPSVLGNNLVKQLKGMSPETLNKAFDRIVLVDEQTSATPEQIEECKEFADTTVGTREISDWYCLLRKTQGNLTPYIEGKLRYMTDYEHEFTSGNTDADYAYIVDLDENFLRVFRHDGERFVSKGVYQLSSLPVFTD